MRIDLFSDVVCPWCYIGITRLERVVATARARGASVDVHLHPFELDPHAPAAGVDVADMLRRKVGRDPQQMFRHVEAMARDAGLPLDLSRQPPMRPTVRAHTLVALADEEGDGQLRLARALFRAHFDEARNIYDVEVLAEIGAAHGLDAGDVRRAVTDEARLSATRARAEQAARSGVRGVPFFLFGGRVAVSGAQPDDVLAGALADAA
jgi:predicted DsbA family dithiol-disulfide isomerase